MKRSAFIIAIQSHHGEISPSNNMKILMGEKTRNDKWQLFGGTLDKDEDPLKGAIREFKEETLLPILKRNIKQGVGFNMDNGDQVFSFLTHINATWNVKLSKEHTEWAWIPVKKILKKKSIFTRKTIKIFEYMQDALPGSIL